MNSWYCSKCKAHREAFRQNQLWSLPPVLAIQLKRFEFSNVTLSFSPGGRRLNTPVVFPIESLDLRPFCLSKSASFPKDTSVRAGQRVEITGLQSATGQKLNGLQGTCMCLDCDIQPPRFCIRLNQEDTHKDWKKVKPENVKLVPSINTELVHEPIYDLVAVSKHTGSYGFGHYVAYARSCVDGKWRLFDDDEVREVQATELEKRSERVGAYVLFYLRRDRRPRSWGEPS